MIQLIKGDCLVEMQNIPDKSIDMILCDLPYGTTACKWDTIIPFEPLWAQYKRIIKDNGAIVLFGSQPFTSALVMSNPKWFKYEWIFEKSTPSNFAICKHVPLKYHENICVFYNKKPTYNPQMTEGKLNHGRGDGKRKTENVALFQNIRTTPINQNTDLKYPKSIQKFNRDFGFHPTQKPTDLLEYLVKTYTNKGDTVLDNTMGSGTTGVACKNLNRSFIGIEMDDKYFDIAVKRINEAQPHVSLFSECP